MLQTVLKSLKLCVYALLVLIGVTFAVSNRGRVDLTFYPLPYVLSLPLFLFALAVLAVGIALGWALARFAAMRRRKAHRDANRRIAALENEVTALRAEQLARPALSSPAA